MSMVTSLSISFHAGKRNVLWVLAINWVIHIVIISTTQTVGLHLVTHLWTMPFLKDSVRITVACTVRRSKGGMKVEIVHLPCIGRNGEAVRLLRNLTPKSSYVPEVCLLSIVITLPFDMVSLSHCVLVTCESRSLTMILEVMSISHEYPRDKSYWRRPENIT